MHHKAVLLQDNSILVVGGRKSPQKPNCKLYTLQLNTGEWRIKEPHESSDVMEPRWRHSVANLKGTSLLFTLAIWILGYSF